MTLTRKDRVRILALTYLDYLPSVQTSSGLISASSSPGAVTSETAPCTMCLGRGRLLAGRACIRCPTKIRLCSTCKGGSCSQCQVDFDEHGCYLCLVCIGTGWRSRRRGEETHDEYTGLSSSELALASQTATSYTRARDHDDGDRLERSRKSRDRSGSYEEFERLLGRLKDNFPVRYALVWHILICGEGHELSPQLEKELDVTLEWIAQKMNGLIRVPRYALPDDNFAAVKKHSLWHGRTLGHQRQRSLIYQEIRQSVESGKLTVNAAARTYGFSRRHVQRILHPS